MIVVADTGPLLHLEEVQGLPLLAAFRGVVVPPLVARECERYRVDFRPYVRVLEVAEEDLTMPIQLRPFLAADVLHAAEAQAIALALSIGAERLLSDDAAAREASRLMGLPSTGSLGVVVQAAKSGLINAVEAHLVLDRFRTSTLFLRSAVLEQAHRLVDDRQQTR